MLRRHPVISLTLLVGLFVVACTPVQLAPMETAVPPTSAPPTPMVSTSLPPVLVTLPPYPPPTSGPASPAPTLTPSLTPAPRETLIPGANEGGLYGQILIGPTCPVVQINNPCPDMPFQATVTVLDAGGQIVTEFQSDALGNFQVNLAPGAYTLRPEPTTKLTRAPEQTVTVTAGQLRLVMIKYDSGIR